MFRYPKKKVKLKTIDVLHRVERQSSKSTKKFMLDHSAKYNCELLSNVKELIKVHGG